MLKKLIEDKSPEFILSWYRYFNFKFGFRRGKKTWSQEGEDILLNRIFGAYQGFYVDVGAHHPFRYSNTHLLYKKGWNGINIDPFPDAIKYFEKHRPNDINLCIGVGAVCGELNFYEFNDPAYNTFDQSLAINTAKLLPNVKITRECKVQVLSLAEIFNRWLPKNTNIDLLDIDVEGLDLEVLLSNDWYKFRPKIILVEIQSCTIESALVHPISSMLKDQGYIMLSKLANTVVFGDANMSLINMGKFVQGYCNESR